MKIAGPSEQIFCNAMFVTTTMLLIFLAWSYPTTVEAGSMLVSDTNSSLAVNAYGGAKHGAVLTLVNNCTSSNPDCTWTYHNGMLVSDTNPSLAVNAYGGAKHGAVLTLVNNCPSNNPDCTWTYRNLMLFSDTDASLALNAHGGARDGTIPKLVKNCPPNNSDCTWTYRKGMFLSDTDASLALNAYGGARDGTIPKLVRNCPSGNPDCTWRVHHSTQIPDQVRTLWGWADLHAHPFAYEGFGGGSSIFFGKAYGPLEEAVPHCNSEHGLGGVNDLVGTVMHNVYKMDLRYGHDTSGSPQFLGWPRWDDVTHQSMHENWLKRAVAGGMRLMVAHAVNNEWMCTTAKGINMTAANLAAAPALITGGPPAAAGVIAGLVAAQIPVSQVAFATGNVPAECKDMPSVDRQIHEAYAMQSSIDAQSGGPGQGWFRIVKNPEEAMDVMRQGKLAVILGIEIDNLFSCYVNSTCTEDSVRRDLDRYFAMGVRHVFPIHFYDNGFGGSANGNFLITNRWKNPMEKRDCQVLGYSYDGGKCNGKGLTDLGKFLIRELALRGMIIDTDHMSALSFSDTMDISEPLGYPVASGHTGFTEIAHHDKNNEGNRTPAELQRIINVRGMTAVIPHQGSLSEISTETNSIPHQCGDSSETVAQAYLYGVHHMPGEPVGIGTDFNGFAGEPGPRFGPQACSGGTAAGYQAKPRLSYPFTITTSSGSVTMDRGVVGQRVYDFNNDGLAHIGLVPDMIADWQSMGMSPTDLNPLFDSAAGYVRLWDRARAASKKVSGIRKMSIEVSPANIVADRPQTITVRATDVYLDDSLNGGEVWVSGQRVASLGQSFTRTVVSRHVPEKCRWERDEGDSRHPGHPRRECEPAHNEASPLEIEVRSSNYANERATVNVSVP